jgi:hypothetical protein
MSNAVPARVKTLRGITAPGILRLVVTLRAKKCKNSSSAQRYNQIRFRFHTAWYECGRLNLLVAVYVARAIAENFADSHPNYQLRLGVFLQQRIVVIRRPRCFGLQNCTIGYTGEGQKVTGQGALAERGHWSYGSIS